ncbi:mRNA 3'-end-processing protein rna-14 [Clathrospora elynae]|uniref:mRNA 3'-end-processing protein RNA14 n=1 Tax=Clathrospora elynae TaxID=706981 RepID=A0A6A5T097_9PLEO|nr:mRNA 3'-end-processing protein rna-14 [Clathrospora elynae]
MADDAERAFLAAQNADEYDPSAGYSMPDAPTGHEYDPATTYSTPSEQSASMPPESAVNSSPPPPATDGDVDGDSESAMQPQPEPPAKRPRTVGGFVDESEDEEETHAPGAAEPLQPSFTDTPNNTLPNHVQLNSAQASVAVHEPALSIASLPNGSTPVPDATKHASLPKARLPQDRVGILEDRIAEDARGDIEAWLSLIEEHRRRHKYDDARAVFERFLKVFPSSGEQWVEYIAFETELDELPKVEQLFARSIGAAQYVAIYSAYIDFIRRRFNLTTDQNGQSRQTVTQAYEFVLGQVGIDVHAGKLWLDYIEMLKTGPGVLGGSNWQDMQKMDTLRKVYQRAVSVPHNATLDIWRDYDKFEMGMNKTSGRKQLQETSPSYMTARSAINVLDNNVTRGINRTTLPKLPPAAGFDGHEAYMNQVQLWNNWIRWEKGDPLECATDNRDLYNKRVLHLYKNALMALRFWPELWYEAAEWCLENNLSEEGEKFLNDGIEANPESCLLAFKKANQVEQRTDFDDGQAGIIAKGKAVREPYMKLLDTIYHLTAQVKKREEQFIARAREQFEAQKAADEAARVIAQKNTDEADDEDEVVAARRSKEKEDAFNRQLQAMSAGYNAQTQNLKKTLTYAWIALMRAMRRVQGKGDPNGEIGGFRLVFTEARKKGKLLSEAYVASALIEHHCYQEGAAQRIFERGMKLFPEDEQFALEYIKHLIKLNDSTNARAVFETVVGKLTAKPENIHRAKSLFVFFHDYEAQFGELAQISKLEQRMASLFPEDPQLLRFSQRFASPAFDPISVRHVISPRTQMRPVMPSGMPSIMPSIEDQPMIAIPPQIAVEQQRLASPGVINSPKRALEDGDDNAQPRKLARGESPLKGAAGRRLDAARRNLASTTGGATPIAQGPPPLPRGVNFLLGIIPAAHTYRETRFKADGLVDLLRNVSTIPVPAGTQPQRWGTTPTTAQQLQSIQEKYGNGGHSGVPVPLPGGHAWGV